MKLATASQCFGGYVESPMSWPYGLKVSIHFEKQKQRQLVTSNAGQIMLKCYRFERAQ